MRCIITDWKWIDLLTRQFDLCSVQPEDSVVVLRETTTDIELASAASAALQRLSPRVIDLVLHGNDRVTPLDNPAIRAALRVADFVVDLTRQGLGDDHRLGLVLDSGTRLLVIGDRNMREIERQAPHHGLGRRIERGVKALEAGQSLLLATETGTHLATKLAGSDINGFWGGAVERGDLAYWPSGRIEMTPANETVEGVLVLMPGDINLTLGEFIRSPVRLEISHDHIVSIEGDSGDADLIRTHLESGGSTEAYGLATIGWGMNQTARVGEPALYDRDHLDSGEAANYAGYGFISVGSNPVADRNSPIELRLALRNTSITIDEFEVIRNGQLQGELNLDVYEKAQLTS